MDTAKSECGCRPVIRQQASGTQGGGQVYTLINTLHFCPLHAAAPALLAWARADTAARYAVASCAECKEKLVSTDRPCTEHGRLWNDVFSLRDRALREVE